MSRILDRDPTSGAGAAFAITPDDSVDLSVTTRGLWVGGAGNVRVLFDRDSSPVTLVGVTAGSLLPIRVKRVYSTGTTATSLVGLY